MKELIKFEYRKLWNKVTIIAVGSFCILITLHTFIYLNLQWRTIDKNGAIVSGLKSYRALKEASEDVEGVLDGEYISNLLAKYDASLDKQYMLEHRGFLGTGGMTKFMKPNYFINYAYFGLYMSNGNDKIGLAYDFLESEELFYQQYREVVLEHTLNLNENRGLFPYSDTQREILVKKAANLQTPFYVAYTQGVENLMNWYNIEYPIFFVVLAFILACIYAKDSLSGINELTLSSYSGRRADFKARCLAGNLFAITVYLIFIGVLMAEHGAIASLHGLKSSAQITWFNCLLNINVGTGLFMKLSGGLLGALVIANLVMLLSVRLKNTKLTAAISLGCVWVLYKLSGTYSEIKLLYPIKFGSNAAVSEFTFVGNIFVPYYVVIVVLTCIYIGCIWLFMRNTDKRYYIN